MKVLHVLNSREYTGAEKVVAQIIRAFAGTSIQMAYCSPYSDNVRDMLAEQDVPYISVGSLTPGNLASVLRAERPDIIHAHDMRASFVSALCCGSIPLISHIHNNAYDARGLSPKSVAYLLAGARAKHIFWVSASSYEGYVFHKLFAKKSSVLYNVIDTQQIFDKLRQDEHTYHYDLIYVGRLTYQKDPQRLIRLCAELKRRKPDLQAAIVGAGELEEETRTLIDSLGLRENVHMLGFQGNPMKMIHDSAAMVLTSRWEGTPMCAMEAMVLGTPVVSTPSDGMRDLLENGVSGYLCQEDGELVEALQKIITDHQHRQTLAENAKRKFDAVNDAAAYNRTIETVYREAL